MNQINGFKKVRPLKAGQTNKASSRNHCSNSSRMGGLLLVVSMTATACGGSDGSDGASSAGQDIGEATSQDGTDGGETSASTDNGNGSDSRTASSSIPWTAPADLEPVSIAVSPDGSQIAIGFETPPTLATSTAQIVVFDVASGTEAWTAQVEDAGILGLGGLMFTDSGLNFFRSQFDGSQIAAFGDDGAELPEVSIDSNCAQYLNGSVDAANNVAYTVVPGGFCRVDLTTGVFLKIVATSLYGGAQLVESIRFDAAGDLVATYTDADFNTVSLVVDPLTLESTGTVADAEPISPVDGHKDKLVEGLNLSSGSRIAASPDGAVVALLQPDSIEIVN